MKTMAEKIDAKLIELQNGILLLLKPTEEVSAELDDLIAKNRLQIIELVESE